MNNAMLGIPSRHSNPFATCWTKPGALRYRFADGKSPAITIDRLAASGWWGQIVGPHGSGKSTLLAELIAKLDQQARTMHRVVVRLPRSRPTRITPLGRLRLGDVLTVDGYDQLDWWERWRIARRCRRAGCGLVVTTHRLLPMPVLARTAPNLLIVQQLVTDLTKDAQHVIQSSDVSASYARHNGNVREIFFDLYDRYERHARQ